MLSFSSSSAFTGYVLTFRSLAATGFNMKLFAGDNTLPNMLIDATRNRNLTC